MLLYFTSAPVDSSLLLQNKAPPPFPDNALSYQGLVGLHHENIVSKKTTEEDDSDGSLRYSLIKEQQ